MKKACLYVFSGTGNTRLCGEMLKKHLDEQGFETTIFNFDIREKNVPNPNDYDLVGIGYPIHAFNIPEAMYKFLKTLPKVNGIPLFFFKTSGEPFHLNDSSSAKSWHVLKKKGFKLIMEKHYLMPYNIMFRYKDNLCKQMYLYLDPLTEVMAIRLAKGEVDKVKYPIRHRILSFFLRIEYIAPKLNAWFTRVDSKKCINCKICLNSCPNGAFYINKKGKLRIHSTCSMCMRCTMDCPKDAIKFGFMNSWRVNGKYNFKKILDDSSLAGDFVNKNTKKYFKLFRKYFKEQNELLLKYNIPVPVTYKPGDEL